MRENDGTTPRPAGADVGDDSRGAAEKAEEFAGCWAVDLVGAGLRPARGSARENKGRTLCPAEDRASAGGVGVGRVRAGVGTPPTRAPPRDRARGGRTPVA